MTTWSNLHLRSRANRMPLPSHTRTMSSLLLAIIILCEGNSIISIAYTTSWFITWMAFMLTGPGAWDVPSAPDAFVRYTCLRPRANHVGKISRGSAVWGILLKCNTSCCILNFAPRRKRHAKVGGKPPWTPLSWREPSSLLIG